jgi:hypothetical protein
VLVLAAGIAIGNSQVSLTIVTDDFKDGDSFSRVLKETKNFLRISSKSVGYLLKVIWIAL